MQKMSPTDFYRHWQRVLTDMHSFEILYDYCLRLIKDYLIYRFGKKQYYSFLNNVPHDVFTKVIIELPAQKLKTPSGYLCACAFNYVMSMYKLKDNCTVELCEDMAYSTDYKEELEFSSLKIEKAWDGLDEKDRYILYASEIQNYQLDEVACIMDLSYDSVRKRKSRAMKVIEQAGK